MKVHSRVWPMVIIVTGLLVTALGVQWEIKNIDGDNSDRFNALTEQVRAEIIRRLGVYHYGLMGTRSVFIASHSVERDEFRSLVSSRNLPEEFPGAMGIGFVQRVASGQVDEFLASTRADGAPDFKINYRGPEEFLYVVKYIEPLQANNKAMGLNFQFEPTRRDGADRAMLTGDAALTGPLTLVQTPTEGTGFLYFLPWYKNGSHPATPEERKANLEGWVYMPLVANRIFAGVSVVSNDEIDFEVYDGKTRSPGSLIYGKAVAAATSDAGNPMEKLVPVMIGGRAWTLKLTTTPRFQFGSFGVAWGIGTAGTLLTIALAALVYTLISTARKAQAMADDMTRDLKRLALVAQNTTNAVIIADAIRRIDWVNDGFTKITGYDIDDVRDLVLDLFLKCDTVNAGSARVIRDALNDGTSCRAEVVIRRKHDGERVVDIEIQALNDEKGRRSGFIAIGTDVTAQVAQRNRLASIFGAIAEGLVLQNPDAMITDCNPGAEKILGYTWTQLNHPTQPIQWDAIHENGEPWPVSEHPASITLKTGEPIRNAIMGIRSGTGDFKWISVNTQPIRSADGTIEAVVSSFADRTEQIYSRNELDKKERLLRAVFDQSRQFVGTLAPDGRLLDANKTALKFANIEDPSQVLGKPFWDCPWWAHSPELQQWLQSAVVRAARGESVRQETTHLSAAGRIHYVDFSITPVRNADGSVMFLIPEGWDITEIKLASEALLKARDAADAATRSKSEFLANMSHEIRTPMTAILGYTDLLAEEWDRGLLPRFRAEYIATIKRNGEHLLSIINDILDLSKIESGKMTVESIDVNPDQLIHDVLSLMQVKAEGKAISLQAFNITPVPASIKTDPLRLRQILINLVGNAIKFTEAGSVTIMVSLDANTPTGPMLRFMISDTGIGMSPEQVSRLFNAFEQADSSTTRKFGGTGLGLRISQRLAQMLGGNLVATSIQGRGSNFTLTLSTGSLDGVAMIPPGKGSLVVRTDAPHPRGQPPNPVLAGLRILMVEDGPDNRRLISFHLRKAGAVVSTAENGKQAVVCLTVASTLEGALLEPAPIDLILMDMQMPEMDGYTATRLLRSKGCKLPIIALTANAMGGDAEKCLNAGCDDYTTKPIDRDVLIRICAKWIRRPLTPAPFATAVDAATPDLSPTTVLAPAPPRQSKSRADESFQSGFLIIQREFIGRFPSRIEDMRRFLEAAQFDELGRLAHQLAGTAGSYGFPNITDKARLLEIQCLKSPDPRGLKELTLELIEMCREAAESSPPKVI